MADNLQSALRGYNYTSAGMGSSIVIARVNSVVMGPFLADGKTQDPDYKSIRDLGKIRYTLVNSNQYHALIGDSNQPARPFFSFFHSYPIQDEYVLLFPGPSTELNQKAGAIEYYYIGPIKLWGSSHHNAMPDLDSVSLFANAMNTNVTTNEVAGGRTINNPGRDMAYPLSPNFPEKNNLKQLIPFVGDTVVEARYGNSIRLGSTNTAFKKYNTWSNNGNDGDPIIIISNGQGVGDNTPGYNPTIENINNDESSIYLTAGQEVVIEDLVNFPLISWDTVIKKQVVVAATMTAPPSANTTFSAQEQDAGTLPGTATNQQASLVETEGVIPETVIPEDPNTPVNNTEANQ